MLDAAPHTMPAMPRTPSLSPDATPIAREIYRRMVEKGFTQKTLADAAGVNATYCRDPFAGRSRNPKTDQINAIAKALDCTLEALQSPSAGGQKAVQDVIDFTGLLPLRPSEIPLLKLWRILGEPARNRIMSEMADLVPVIPRRKADNI